MIIEASNDEHILRCFPVMHELRPHIATPQDLLTRVRRQMERGYHLVFLQDGQSVLSAAGYRLAEMLAWGRHMYVDDLVTAGAAQGTGCGSKLFDWLIAKARATGCEQFHLDSGVHRFGAHRFYLHKGMDITAHHFAMKL